MKSYYLHALFFLQFSIICNAQDVFVTAGGDYTNSNIQLNTSVGQVFFTEIENNNLSFAQGVQWAELSNNVSAVNIDWDQFKVYPNPTADKLVLDFPCVALVEIRDVNATLVKSLQVMSLQEIELRDLQPAVYLIDVRLSSEKSMKYKIIKL